MELLERIGDFFSGMVRGVDRALARTFGSANERLIRRLGFVRDDQTVRVTPGSVLDRINQLEPEFAAQSEGELAGTAARLRAKLADGKTLDDILPEAFAAVREAGKRYLRMRHYDVQMIGGWVLHNGSIAEMVTGEGKTLVATLPAFLNGLAGSVHVVTVNDYLARRDMEWMAPVYMGLGLTVGAIQSHQENAAKIKAYRSDITYGTNNEFGFDYLRDNMKGRLQDQVQGPLNYAIIDEVDNILIDEARTPLIIAGPSDDDVTKYPLANRIALQLKPGVHFEIKEKEHSCNLTDEGVRQAEQLAGVESFYTPGNMEWPHLIDNALKAHHLYKRDVNYVVQGNEVIIVDEFTGRLMPGRNWSDGLHQAVEAKEGIRIKPENQTLATITLQNFFKLYKKLAGMTGTAMTEAHEFMKIYKLNVVAIPPNRPMKRVNHPDVIYRTEREKFEAITQEVREIHATGRPILVGTVSIEKSERLSSMLNRYGVRHEVLNAKHHEREADIIAQAGRLNAVTIATNMAGRGTDIILGGNPDSKAWELLKTKYESRIDVPKAEWDALTRQISEEQGMAAEGRKVAELGGLHVIGSERHEARRIDLQLRGRSGRQGDPGSSRFFLSLEDDLMRIFGGDWFKDLMKWAGMQEGEAIEHSLLTRQIEKAQRRVEERNFEIRKNLLEYDEVMDQQRRRVYGYRQAILEGRSCRQLIMEMIRQQVQHAARDTLSARYAQETCASWAARTYGIEADPRELRDLDLPMLQDFFTAQAERQAEDLLQDQIETDLPRDVENESEWNWQAFSKWVNSRYGLNTNERELKKIGRDNLYEQLLPRIRERIQAYDFSPLEQVLDEGFGRAQLIRWVEHQYGVAIEPDAISGKPPEEAAELIMARLDAMYTDKEILFPVTVGMNRFLAQSSGAGGQRYDREGIARWAAVRFEVDIPPSHFAQQPRHEIQQALLEMSKARRGEPKPVDQVDAQLDRVYGARTSQESDNDPVADPGALPGLAAWVREHLLVELRTDEIQPLPRGKAQALIMSRYEQRFRPELAEAERSLILAILDSAWKDHLYYMDHLRQSVGLTGYAGKDPKVEYKREGMKAFETMWKRIGDQVTSAVFRMDELNPEFVGDLWRITEVRHDAAPTAAPPPPTDEAARSSEAAANNGSAVDRAIEPIRNYGKRVGRNDPCPCGSGKKYKNCCMP